MAVEQASELRSDSDVTSERRHNRASEGDLNEFRNAITELIAKIGRLIFKVPVFGR
jgi:hypothetical protein